MRRRHAELCIRDSSDLVGFEAHQLSRICANGKQLRIEQVPDTASYTSNPQPGADSNGTHLRRGSALWKDVISSRPGRQNRQFQYR